MYALCMYVPDNFAPNDYCRYCYRPSVAIITSESTEGSQARTLYWCAAHMQGWSLVVKVMPSHPISHFPMDTWSSLLNHLALQTHNHLK